MLRLRVPKPSLQPSQPPWPLPLASQVEGGLASARGAPPSLRRVSFSGTATLLGPPSAAPSLTATMSGRPLMPGLPGARAGQGAGGGGGASVAKTWPPQLTPSQIAGELGEAGRLQAVVQKLEGKLGKARPQVGACGVM